MIDISRIVAILAFVLQLGNGIMFFVNAYAPEYAVIAGGILAAIQAFTARIQGTPTPGAGLR